MIIDPKSVTLDTMERHMIRRALQTQIKVYEKKAKTSKVPSTASNYADCSASAQDLLTKIEEMR